MLAELLGWVAPLAAVTAVGAWIVISVAQGRRPRSTTGVEAARAALLAVPPGVVLAALVVGVLWLRPLVDHALDQPAGDTPGGPPPAPPPPNPLEIMVPLGVPLPLALAGTTMVASWLAVFGWRLRRPQPDPRASSSR